MKLGILTAMQRILCFGLKCASNCCELDGNKAGGWKQRGRQTGRKTDRQTEKYEREPRITATTKLCQGLFMQESHSQKIY